MKFSSFFPPFCCVDDNPESNCRNFRQQWKNPFAGVIDITESERSQGIDLKLCRRNYMPESNWGVNFWHSRVKLRSQLLSLQSWVKLSLVGAAESNWGLLSLQNETGETTVDTSGSNWGVNSGHCTVNLVKFKNSNSRRNSKPLNCLT